jgi:predicted nucleic acid-binding protein
MPKIVCDSSTLIHVASIGRLFLLQDLFEELTIPAAVWREVVEEGKGRSGVTEVEAAVREGWIHVHSVEPSLLLRSLKQDLDSGEAEVIALALELEAGLVLLDESEGRRKAEAFGLKMTGVVGILMRAKLEGKITALRPELDRLRKGGFWVDGRLYWKVLQVVSEE